MNKKIVKFIAITRRGDWEAYTGVSSHDFIVLWIAASIYFVMTLAFVIGLVYFTGKWVVTKIIICLLCSSLFGLRAIGLVLAAYAYNVAPITEFPTFAFFSVVIWYAVVLYFALLPGFQFNAKKDYSQPRYSLRLWSYFAVPLWLFYIAIMIANGTVATTKEVTLRCYNRISDGPEARGTRDIITLTYRVILLGLSCLVSVSLLFFTIYVLSHLKGVQSAMIKRQSRILATLFAIHSIAFPLHALVLILFETLEYHNISVGVAVMMVVEVVPGICIIYSNLLICLHPKGKPAFASSTLTPSNKN